MVSRRYLKLALGLALLCSGTSSVFAAPGDLLGDENVLLSSTTVATGNYQATDEFTGKDAPCVAYEATMSAKGSWWMGIFEKADAEKWAADVLNGVYGSSVAEAAAPANNAAKELALSGSTCEFESSTTCEQTHNLDSSVTYVAAILNPSTSSSVSVTSLTAKECTAEQAAAASSASAITAVSAAILATVGALAL